MGSIENLAKAAFKGTHFTASLRFDFEAQKGFSVGEMGIGVIVFWVWGSEEAYLPHTSEEKIKLCLLNVKASRKVNMILRGSDETSNGGELLRILRNLQQREDSSRKGMFLSLGIRKYVDSRLSGLYILRDSSAMIVETIQYPDWRPPLVDHANWRVEFRLAHPVILYGSGPNAASMPLKQF